MDGEERGSSGGKNQPTHVCRTLLRANILMSLAGIISADGGRTHARRSSAHFPGRRFSASAQVCRDYIKRSSGHVVAVATLRLQSTVSARQSQELQASLSSLSLSLPWIPLYTLCTFRLGGCLPGSVSRSSSCRYLVRYDKQT